MNIIFFSQLKWDKAIYQRHNHICTLLAEKNKVLFIEPIAPFRKNYFKAKKIKNNLFILSVVPNMEILAENVKNPKIEKIFLSISKNLKIDQFLETLRRWHFKKGITRFNVKDVKLLFGSVYYNKFIDYFSDCCVFYDYVDNIFGFKSAVSKKEISEKWMFLVKKSKVVFVTSADLLRQVKKYHKNIKFISNGVDVEHFKRKKINNGNKKIVIGYMGMISDWFDFNIIEKIAEEFSYTEINLIGPVSKSVKNYAIALNKKFDNIKFLGPINYQNLPKYLNKFTIAIIPFKVNRLTRAVDPVKFYEYSACSLPVVCTDLAELYKYKDCVYTVKNHKEFINKIKMSLGENDDDLTKKRRQIAIENSWCNKILEIEKIIK